MFSFFKHLFHNPDYKSEQNESSVSQLTELKSESKINQEDQEPDLNSEQSIHSSKHESDSNSEINGDFAFLKSDKNAEEKVRKAKKLFDDYNQWVEQQTADIFEWLKPLILFQGNFPKTIDTEYSLRSWYGKIFGECFDKSPSDYATKYFKLLDSINLDRVIAVETLYTVNRYADTHSLEIKNKQQINHIECQLYNIFQDNISNYIDDPIYRNVLNLEIILEDKLIDLVKEKTLAYNLGQINQINHVIFIFSDYESEKRFKKVVDSFLLIKKQKEKSHDKNQVSDKQSENKVLYLPPSDFDSEKINENPGNDRYSWKKFDVYYRHLKH